MKLTLPKGVLTLPENFTFELEITNPFFTEDGSGSVPVNIPASPENLAILGYPSRLGGTAPTIKTFPATLSHGIFHTKGKLLFDSIARSEGISCVFITHESTLYSEFQDKKLKELLAEVSPISFLTQMYGGSIAPALYNMYKKQELTYEQYAEDVKGLVVFPAMLQEDDFGFKMLNEPNSNKTGFVHAARTLTNSQGDTLTLPYGYGLTVFIRLWRMLELLFQQAGYSVAENIFTESPYCDIVVLNNCADACVYDSIIFADLVPDITMGELILWLKDKFGAIVKVDDSIINIRLQEDCTHLVPDIDLTPYVLDSESITFPPSSRIIINSDTSLEGAAPPADLPINQYLSKYTGLYPIKPLPFEENDSEDYFAWTFLKKVDIPALIFRDGQILKFDRNNMFSILTSTGRPTLLGSNAFRYDRGISDDEDKRETTDKFIPTVIDSEHSLSCPYIGEAIHRHTRLQSKSAETVSQPLQICWCFWDSSLGHWAGSSQPYKFSTERISNQHVPLTPDGCYHLFWKSYNRMLISSAPEITFELDLPLDKAISLDPTIPKLYKGQHIIIKSFSITISNGKSKCGECTAVLVPQYLNDIYDADLYDPNTLEWKRIGYTYEDLERLGYTIYDGLENYTASDCPTFVPDHLGQVEKYRVRKGYNSGGYQTDWYEAFIAVLKE